MIFPLFVLGSTSCAWILSPWLCTSYGQCRRASSKVRMHFDSAKRLSCAYYVYILMYIYLRVFMHMRWLHTSYGAHCFLFRIYSFARPLAEMSPLQITSSSPSLYWFYLWYSVLLRVLQKVSEASNVATKHGIGELQSAAVISAAYLWDLYGCRLNHNEALDKWVSWATRFLLHTALLSLHLPL